jgi:ABC-type transporter Mla maintaining outer membrane lipid asymmetry ATPase subunit MlaF
VLGVVGGSGAGKSVLLNTIIGLKEPDGGTVKLFGQDMRRASSPPLERRSSGAGACCSSRARCSRT